MKLNNLLLINYGNQQPLFITSTEYISPNDAELHQFILDLDNKFKTTNNKYEISINQLEQNIQKSQEELMKHFQTTNLNNISVSDINDNIETDDTDFQFMRIY